jgi:hypothetical protein
MSYKDPIPETCPECHVPGWVTKLISVPARGKVELTGDDLVQSVMSSASQDRSRAGKDENFYANMVGESKYNESLLQNKQREEKVNSVIKDYKPSFYKSQASKRKAAKS